LKFVFEVVRIKKNVFFEDKLLTVFLRKTFFFGEVAVVATI